jgi:hypothetical protein
MASEALSIYELRSKRRALAGSDVSVKSEQKSKLINTAEGIGRDVLIGVLGGGLASAILGKYSFIGGLVVAGYGHYSENKALAALGLGMMASGTFMALTGKKQDQKKPLPDRIKERLEIFKEELKQKVFLDKILAEKTVDEKKQEKKAETPTVKNNEQEEDELTGLEKYLSKSEIEQIKKQAESEAEKDFAEYQENQKKKQAAEFASKSSVINYSPGNQKNSSGNENASKQTISDKAVMEEVKQMERLDNLF